MHEFIIRGVNDRGETVLEDCGTFDQLEELKHQFDLLCGLGLVVRVVIDIALKEKEHGQEGKRTDEAVPIRTA